MTLYMVIQESRRDGFRSSVVIIEAKSGAAAVRGAAALHPDYISAGPNVDQKKPHAVKIASGQHFFI